MLGWAMTIVIAPNRADFRAQAVTDAFVAVNDDGLSTEHGKDVASGQTIVHAAQPMQ